MIAFFLYFFLLIEEKGRIQKKS